MQIYYDVDSINSDVEKAINGALARHNLNDAFSAMAVCAVLRAISSPLKKIMSDGRLANVIGMAGTDLFIGSALLQAVERIRNPDSLIVSPVMDCIVIALSKARAPLKEGTLMKQALKIYLEKTKLSKDDIKTHFSPQSSYRSAFHSATGYLTEAKVIENTIEYGGWQLTSPYSLPISLLKRQLD